VDGSFEKLIEEIQKYAMPLFDGYDRVLNLRIFRGKGHQAIQYNLVEIPKGMFLAIGDLKPTDFTPFRPTHGTSAVVKYKDQKKQRNSLESNLLKFLWLWRAHI